MKCLECFSTDGHYQEIEDLNSELDYVYYTAYHCHCGETTYQWNVGFVWPDEEELQD